MSMIETRDGTRLFAKIWGQGRPVILIHGWPLNADSWDDHAVVLAEAGYKVIAYDRRGFGRSDQPWNGYDYDTLADDLADVIEATGARDAALFGFSMGGGEVARYLSRHGSANIRQAGLISSVVPYMLRTPDNPKGTSAETFQIMTEQMRADRPAFMETFNKAFYGVGLISQPVSSALIEWARSMSMMAGMRPTLACAAAFTSTDFRPDLPAFDVPTLIIHGTADETVPIDASARAAAAAIPQSRLIEYEGAPHGLLATHKQRAMVDMLDFLVG